METLEKIFSFLDLCKVPYTHTVHSAAFTALEVAHVEHIPEHMVAKTVVFVGPDGYGMAVLPADFVIDLEDLRACLGVSHLRLATEFELQELFPACEVGAMPPLGNSTLYEMPVYVDSSLGGQEEIAFNAGTHSDVLRMKYADWESLVNPKKLHFAHMAAAH